MYAQLKPLEALRPTELPQVAAPWYAISCLKQAQSSYCRIDGFHKAWEACIREHDPHRYHWNHRARGFERLCAKIEAGDWVVVLAKSAPLLAPAYVQVSGHWEPNNQHVFEFRARQRYTSQTHILDQRQREVEAFQSQNRPPTAKEIEPASGPGTRVASLGPHVGSEAKVTEQNVFKSQDEAAKHVSKSINTTSIRENREYGGMIYQNKDGTYGYTTPIKGSLDGVDPGGPSSVPEGTKAIAYYHTHGGDTPGYDNENFSDVFDPISKEHYGDIPYADANKIDGYLATPKGAFKRYSYVDKKVVDLGKL